MVDLVDINTNNPDIITQSIKLLRVNTMIVTKALLNSKNVPYIGSIPISSEDYITESNNTTQEQIKKHNVYRSSISFTTGIQILA